MITVYLDESGTHDEARHLVIAGLVSTLDGWEALTTEWGSVREEFQAPVFHMADCCQGRGDFKGWSKERRNALVKRLVDVIVKHTSHRLWTVVEMGAVRGSELESQAYGLCAFGCSSLLRSSLMAPSNLHIPNARYVFEHGAKDSGRAFEAFDHLLNSGMSDYLRIGSITKANRREIVPLQPADLHAWEVYKYFKDKGERVMRQSLAALLSIPEAGGGGYFLNAAAFEEWAKRIATGERNSDGTIALPRFRLTPAGLVSATDGAEA